MLQTLFRECEMTGIFSENELFMLFKIHNANVDVRPYHSYFPSEFTARLSVELLQIRKSW
jgi:hypothetical protein